MILPKFCLWCWCGLVLVIWFRFWIASPRNMWKGVVYLFLSCVRFFLLLSFFWDTCVREFLFVGLVTYQFKRFHSSSIFFFLTIQIYFFKVFHLAVIIETNLFEMWKSHEVNRLFLTNHSLYVVL